MKQDPSVAYGSNFKVGQQISEFRKWIDNAMKQERMDRLTSTPSVHESFDAVSAQNLEIPGVDLGKKGKGSK